MGRCAAVLSAEGFWCSRATPECPGAYRPDGPQGPIRSRSPPRSRVGADAAGIAGADWAAPSRTPYNLLRISIARPFKTPNPRPKPLPVRCRRWRPAILLDEKAVSPQCPKMVRMSDLSASFGVVARLAAFAKASARLRVRGRVGALAETGPGDPVFQRSGGHKHS